VGKVLQIRVMAWTPQPADLEARWPRLAALVLAEIGAPGGRARELGVVEMAEALADLVRFGALGAAPRQGMLAALEPVERAKARLDAALADWKPAEANTASDALEEALDGLEAVASKP
jgi:hypothetical protein